MYLSCLHYDDYVDHDGGDDANLDDDQDNDDDDDVRKGDVYFAPLLPTTSFLSRLATAATSSLF